MMILGKMLIPNPNYPALIEPTVGKNSFMRFNGSKNHTIAIAPNSTETLVSFEKIQIINEQFLAEEVKQSALFFHRIF